MAFKTKVMRLLKASFPPPDHIEVEDENGIIGTVISDRFKGLDTIERQQILSQALDDKLTGEERKRIVIIIAMTPREQLAHTAV
jgi:stress-induced morphogen